ncbi:MAG: hypothetical protein RLZZ416_511 [Candidatus Parcubacteria bacterium]|jgi:hypothetical protein
MALLTSQFRHARAKRMAVFSLSFALTFVTSAAVAFADLENPLKPEFSDIPRFIAGALRVLVVVALPIISLFVVVAGFMFIWARGNASELEKAKKNFVYVIIGALLILGAWVIATLIGGTVSQVVGGV